MRTDVDKPVPLQAGRQPDWKGLIFSGMDHQGEFRRAALELGITGDEISRFSRHLRLSIALSVGGDSPVGQFGGLPRLPVGMKWPSAGDIPLPLLLSVDCGALPRVDGFDLPADGHAALLREPGDGP
ncbi:DUF1963 domain-containing protein [Streptomyces sp. NPDC088812]|uniref:DUF1963 domain-containing protein n=1 Tax=Streptomyces sp. NPDC088812 TaxID=3365905 RepID=UPI003819BE09